MKFSSFLFIAACFFFTCSRKNPENQTTGNWVISAPAGSAYTQINRDSITIIPNGRFLTPRGRQISVAPHPYGLVVSHDGNTVVTANSGTNPISISIIRNVLSENPQVQQIPPGADTDKGILASVFMGLAISPDNQIVYVAGGQENKIFMFSLANGQAKGFINCALKTADKDYTHGYIGDLVLSRDGKSLYAVDQINFRMVIVDTEKKQVMHNIGVGRYPFGITLSPDEKKAYVANVGMYEYS
jgi:YVTN family beta-propeller protein